jgi:DNA polymerase-3 subunit beta
MTSEKELKFIVPEKALTQVHKTFDGGKTSVTVSEDHVRFKNDDTIIVSRLIDAQYPNYESVIPRENDRLLRINKDEMLATVRRVSIFSSTTTKDKVEICAEDIDMSSEAKESVKCEYDNEEMVIGFNAKYLADVLTHIEDDEVEFAFSTPNRAGIVRPLVREDNREMLMLVMPVMLNTYA